MHIALDENTHDFMLEMFEEYDEWAFYDRFQDTYLYDHHHFEAVDLHYQSARTWMAAGNLPPDWYEAF